MLAHPGSVKNVILMLPAAVTEDSKLLDDAASAKSNMSQALVLAYLKFLRTLLTDCRVTGAMAFKD